MKKQSESENKRSRWPYLAPMFIWLFVFGEIVFSARGEMFFYVMATGFPIGLSTLVIAVYGTEGVKLKDIQWLRIVPFIAWLICFYILLIWASTQKTSTPLFYLMIIGLPLGIVLLGVSIYPVLKKYD